DSYGIHVQVDAHDIRTDRTRGSVAVAILWVATAVPSVKADRDTGHGAFLWQVAFAVRTGIVRPRRRVGVGRIHEVVIRTNVTHAETVSGIQSRVAVADAEIGFKGKRVHHLAGIEIVEHDRAALAVGGGGHFQPAVVGVGGRA